MKGLHTHKCLHISLLNSFSKQAQKAVTQNNYIPKIE